MPFHASHGKVAMLVRDHGMCVPHHVLFMVVFLVSYHPFNYFFLVLWETYVE